MQQVSHWDALIAFVTRRIKVRSQPKGKKAGDGDMHGPVTNGF